MKKLTSLILALFALVNLTFAKTITIKSDKLRNLKSVAKVAQQLGMYIVENYSDMWIAKSEDSDDFAVYYSEKYEDGDVILAIVYVQGQMLSRIECDVKEENGQKSKAILKEYDRTVIFNDNGSNVYLTDFGTLFETIVCMEHRNRIRTGLAEKYNLMLPERTAKNDQNFRALFEEINPTLSEKNKAETIELLTELRDSNFVY